MSYHIREVRKEAGITQAELAAKLNINRATLSKYESGIIEPTLSQLRRIADALDSDIIFLLPDSISEVYQAGMVRAIDEMRRNHEYESDLLKNAEELSPKLQQIFDLFDMLNEDGRQKAVERIEELTEIPRYQKSKEPLQDD